MWHKDERNRMDNRYNMRNILFSIMLTITFVAFGQDFSNWKKFSCDIYQVNDDQNPSIWVASVLKEVKGVYYCKTDVDVGRYEIQLQKISDNFFRIRETGLYIELRGYVPYRSDYSGILDIDAMVVQSPFDNSYSCVGTTEYFYLKP